MFGFSKYNYEKFTRDLLAKDMVKSKMMGGPRPGERAPDFSGRTIDGEKLQLSDFRGEKNVVLAFGSATCPMTAGSISGMNDLFEEYNGDDVQFIFVYVREAHPGEDIPAHSSYEDKIEAAELLREEDEIEMPIIVDDLSGTIHKKYGKLPNPTYLIDKSGRVAFRCLWTDAGVVEDALEELLERQRDRDVEHAVVNGGEDTSMHMKNAFVYSHRALRRGGDQAVADFREAMGMPGRLALLSSRVTEPIIMNPAKVVTAVAITGGVIVGGLIAGRELRRRRFTPRETYRVYAKTPPRRMTGTDYEPVGI
ncbi:MAG: redoxin domain-containing protein [Acidobacteria bacterium]|nr:redoxin domain-containing protein [Acidobacteriota bacterium]